MKLVFYVAAAGNVFMRELADRFAEGVRLAGYEAEVRAGGLPDPDHGDVPIIVAPHEFFVVEPDAAVRADEFLPWCALYNTEQPDNHWFDSAADLAGGAAATFDLSMEGALAFHERGIVAQHFPVGFDVRLREPPEWSDDRRYDIAFLGDATPRRRHLLGQYGELLERYDTRLLLHDSTIPVEPGRPGFVSGLERDELLGQTRVMLHLHRDVREYFTWHRMLPAIEQGCVILSEPVVQAAPLTAFRDFVQADFRDVPAYLELLLSDHGWREELADSAARQMRQECTSEQAMQDAAPSLERIATIARSMPRRGTAAPAPDTDTRRFGDGSYDPFPRIDRDPVSSFGITPLTQSGGHLRNLDENGQSAMLRKLFLDLQSLRRSMRATASGNGSGPTATVAHRTPSWSLVEPTVTVVVPVYNYAQYVKSCLDSVRTSVGVELEVVIIDDASEDDSRAVAIDYLERHPELPATLVSFSLNTGLPSARNEGYRRARAPYVFPLDVDNMLLPRGLERLARALDRDPTAGFAYGLLAHFGACSDLDGYLAWSVDRLSLGNYVDAMALVRKTTWEAVGGYCDDESAIEIYGWEDYDFWLGCVEENIDGSHVPEIVGRYRVRAGSMIAVTNLDPVGTFAALRKRRPDIAWPADHERRS